jgi:hypothetical protein
VAKIDVSPATAKTAFSTKNAFNISAITRKENCLALETYCRGQRKTAEAFLKICGLRRLFRLIVPKIAIAITVLPVKAAED